ncbi:ABC transporter permease [Chromohalobacter sp. TMW 2.2308]|uniref:ABC transporter permease n=1 Tax=Chromohalobacter TaxID=42054 RepID=UPI00045CF394|nr:MULTISPECIES: ABC transporter permease [Chromohalobacter]MCK2042892.1 ABC transporter permease [Chromohalobacter moromii]MCT8514588.1 ABC transporter permease [Chromohalobacter sp. TMW 2.2271]CDQ35138.1 Ribose transport system permease protein RbsC [Virgibacillus halodenitrificans]
MSIVVPDNNKPMKRNGFRFDIKTWGPFIALIALAILGVLINSAFLGADNLSNMLTRSAFIGIIAVGATFVITAGGLDLSVGSMAAFIAGVMIILMNGLVEQFGVGITTVLFGIGASLILGMGAGFINGVVTTKGKIEAFIVTLGTMGIYRSLVTYLADGGTLTLDWNVRDVYRPVYYESLLGIPIPVWVFLLVALVGYVLLNYTRFGRYCFAIGSNEKVAEYSAIHVDRVKTLTYVLQGVCVSLATIIYVPRLGSASAATGVLWELEAIAAVIIGGTVLKGGHGRIWGTVVGAIMLTMIGNILNLTDAISNYLNGTVQGIIIIVAVYLQRASWKKNNV